MYVPQPDFKFQTIGGLLDDGDLSLNYLESIIKFFDSNGKEITKENFKPVKRLEEQLDLFAANLTQKFEDSWQCHLSFVIDQLKSR